MPSNRFSGRRGTAKKPGICRPSPDPYPGHCDGKIILTTPEMICGMLATGKLHLHVSPTTPTHGATILFVPDVGTVEAPQTGYFDELIEWQWDNPSTPGHHLLKALYQFPHHPTCIYTTWVHWTE